jgi:hypothetical protein
MLFRAKTLGGVFLAGVCGLGAGCQSTMSQFGASKSSSQEQGMLADNSPQTQSTSSKVASFFHYSGDDVAAKHNAAEPQPQGPSKIASLFQWKSKNTNDATQTPDQQQIVLRQGNEIQWQANTAQDQPGQVKSGTGIVGPDGTAELGPYGTVRLAGMNLTQATAAVEKHLSAFMATPSVQLSATVTDNTPTVAGRSQRTSQPTYVRSGTMSSGQSVITTSAEPELQTVNWRPAASGN